MFQELNHDFVLSSFNGLLQLLTEVDSDSSYPLLLHSKPFNRLRKVLFGLLLDALQSLDTLVISVRRNLTLLGVHITELSYHLVNKPAGEHGHLHFECILDWDIELADKLLANFRGLFLWVVLSILCVLIQCTFGQFAYTCRKLRIH